MAAHLHDSVLQTLALIQPRRRTAPAAALARRQERELRGWLYGTRPTGGTLAARCRAVAAEVEAGHDVGWRRWVVGDRAARPRLTLVPPRARHGERGPALGGAGRSTSTSRSSRRPGRRCSCATAARASTRRRCPATGRLRGRSSVGCTGTAARHGPQRPGEGTEVQLQPARSGPMTGAPVRVFVVDDQRCSAPASAPSSGDGRRRRRGGRRRRGRQRHPAPRRTSCCSTCTCPAAAGEASTDAARPSAGAALPRPVGVRRGGGRHRGDPCRAAATSPRPPGRELSTPSSGSGRRRRVLTAAGRFRAGRVRRGSAPPPRDPELDPLTPRERDVMRLSPAATRTRRSPARALHLGEDGRDPRVGGAAQAPALEPARADPWAADRRLL